jgi:hypothetical protein
VRALVRWALPRLDRVYRQPDFLDAWPHVHDDLEKFDERLDNYRAAAPEVRRAARLLLYREIERRRAGKADTVRSVALATLTSLAVVGVGIWSSWSASVFALTTDAADEPLSPAQLARLFAEALTPTFWAFSVVVLVLLFVVYIWAIASWGADKRRGVYVAWLATFDRVEMEKARPRGLFGRLRAALRS